jgi:hypothetical protein
MQFAVKQQVRDITLHLICHRLYIGDMCAQIKQGTINTFIF